MAIRYLKNLLLLLCCLSLPAMVAAQPQAKTAARRASLDSLVARVDSYWRLLQEQKRLSAAEYVIPSRRETFVSSGTPAFTDPQISSLELSPDRNSAKVTVIVKRIFPNQIMNWPVTEQWFFESGNWYLQPNTLSLPISSSAQDKPLSPNAEQKEGLRKELEKMLRFENPILNLGTVRQGPIAYATLKYTLAGNQSLPVDIDRTKPGSESIGLKERTLVPGQSKELAFGISTLNYDGAFNERVVLVVNKEGVDVPFEVTVQGNVYVPVSLNPKILRFLTNESEKELLVRNNTKERLELKSLFSETNAVIVEPLPATILPGQQLKLKFRKVMEVGNPNTRDNLSISLTQPVDGIASLPLPVVLNYVEPKRHESDDPLNSREIQELLRKNQTNTPIR
jgi:hypothetical protein